MSSIDFLTNIFPNEGLRSFLINELLRHWEGTIPVRKIYILCGNGSNGKTTFQRFVETLIPCKVIYDIGDGQFLWDALTESANSTEPLFIAVHSLNELDFLDSADLWDYTHIIPMTANVPSASIDLNVTAKDFLEEYTYN